MNTPTPETDAFWLQIDDSEFDTNQIIDKLKQFERERDAARAALSGRTVSCSNCNELGYKLAGFEAEVAGLRADNEEMREVIREAHEAIEASPYPDQQALAKLQPYLK